MTAERKRVLNWLEGARDALVTFLLEFGNVASPRGREGDASRFLVDWLQDRGLPTRLQPVIGDLANVIATLPGGATDGGENLILNGHLDTAHGDPVEDGQLLAEQPRAYRESWREGPFLKGDDIVNDKGPSAPKSSPHWR